MNAEYWDCVDLLNWNGLFNEVDLLKHRLMNCMGYQDTYDTGPDNPDGVHPDYSFCEKWELFWENCLPHSNTGEYRPVINEWSRFLWEDPAAFDFVMNSNNDCDAPFKATLDIDVVQTLVIDLQQSIIDCFGQPDQNGDFIDCNNFNGSFSATVYSEQPNPNSRDTYDGIIKPDVGHSFLSLSVFESGNTNTLVFGFYPTALDLKTSPISPSAIGDDEGHPYDVSITYLDCNDPTCLEFQCNDFNNLLKEVISQSANQYDLNNYNCTDFVINSINNTIGANVPDNQGTWPDGGGSNPGDLGEDIRTMTNGTINTDGGNAPASNCN